MERSPDDVALFDSHCHLTDDRFGDDRGEVLAAARQQGVRELVTVGTDPRDARAARELAAAEEGVWATAGLHPHDARRLTDGVLEELEELAGADEVVAVGETGLDFHYENSPRAAQRESFREQMELAGRVGLPVVVHSRDADEETARVVSEHAGQVRGVLHCFTGGPELLEAGLEAGWYVSLSGIATFGSFEAGWRVERIPDERLLLETDSPYLAPVPRRGRRNEPAYLVDTCRAVAELRGEPPERTAELTRRNARRFYGVGEIAGGGTS